MSESESKKHRPIKEARPGATPAEKPLRAFPMQIVFGLLLVVVIFGLVVYIATGKPKVKTQPACTLEAKVCPDGSTVAREGPDCEFAACPGPENSDDSPGLNPIEPPRPAAALTKKYTDALYGYSISYPDDWHLDSVRTTKSEVVFAVPGSEGRESIRVEQTGLTAEQWSKGLNKKTVTGISDVTIDGQPAKQVEHNVDNQTQTAVKRGRYLYVFTTTNKAMIDSGMLTSFRFGIVAAEVTGNWRTFTHRASGLGFKYPPAVKLDASQAGRWQFCQDGACYDVSVTDITEDRRMFWQSADADNSVKYNFAEYKKNGNVVFRSQDRAFDVVLTPKLEIQIAKRGPEGAGVQPSTTKGETFLGLESTVTLAGKNVL